jgi:hypothetical protein
VTAAILTLLAAWLLLTAAGLVVLALAPGAVRDRLLPAAPLVGVSLTVAVLHWTTLLLPVRHGLVVLGLVLVALAVVAVRRRGLVGVRPSRPAVAALGLATLLGVLPAGLVLAPSLANDGALVLPTRNHDAYYYVAAAEWLTDNRGISAPEIAADQVEGDPPAYGPSLFQIEEHIRLGETLAQAAVGALLGRPQVEVFFPMLALYVLTLPGSVTAAFRLVGLPTPAGLLAGLAVTAYPYALYQAHEQHSPSLLGLVVLPVALTAVVLALDARPVLPRWVAALLLVGWLGSYTEYAAVGAPAVLLALLARRPSQWWPALRGGAVVGVLAVAMAPLLWLNAVRSLLFLAGLPEPPRDTPFNDITATTLLNRLVGAGTITGGELPSRTAPLLTLLVVSGVVLAVALSRRRGLWAGAVFGVAVAVAQFSFGDPRPYTQMRVIGISMPVLVFVACAGWSTAVVAARARPALVRHAVLAGSLLALLAWVAVEGRTSVRYVQEGLEQARPVDAAFGEAREWVEELAAPGGEDVTVVTGEFFDQMWLAYALRDSPGVSYAGLSADYLAVQSYWGGESDPLVLVDEGVFVDADPAVVVRSNDRFRLLDLRRGDAVVASTYPASGLPWIGERPTTWTEDDAPLVLLCSTAPCAAELEVRAVDSEEPVPFAVLQDGEVLVTSAARPDQPTEVPLALTRGRAAGRLLLDVLDPQPRPPGTARPAVRLLDVRAP